MAFRKTVPLQKWEKLDDGGLSFEACFSSDRVDKQGEVIPQPVTQAAVERWAAKNLREMHKDEAVGKALDFDFRADGTSWLNGFVTSGAPNTVKKVEDGVLQMLSVAGSVKKQHKEVRNGKTVTVIDDFDLSEISLVDAGANPDAWISVAKAAGLEKALPPPKEGEEEEGKEKPEGDEEKPEETMPKEGEDGEPPAKPAEGEGKPPEAGAGLTDEQMAKIVDAVLTALQANAVAAPAAAPTAKVDGSQTYQVKLNGAGLLDPENVETVKAMKKALDAVDATPAPVQKTDNMAPIDIRTGLDALGILEGLRSVETYEVTEGTPEPPEQIKLLDAAIAAVKAFIASEAGELVEGEKPPADMSGITEKVANGAALRKFITEQGTRVSGLSEQTGTILKAVESLKADIGEARANRETPDRLEKIEKSLGVLGSLEEKLSILEKVDAGITQILSMPIPGNTPLRLVTQGALAKSDSTHAIRADALKTAAAGAPSQVREYLLREASAIERTYHNG